MILLIDDERNIKADKVARTYKEGVKALQEHTWDLLYLDHDLECYEGGREYTGYHIMCWLEEHPEHLPKRIEIVSDNPVGRVRMQLVIDKLYGR